MSRYSRNAFTKPAEFRNESLFAPFLPPANDDTIRIGPLGISCPDGGAEPVNGAIPAPWMIAAMQRGAA